MPYKECHIAIHNPMLQGIAICQQKTVIVIIRFNDGYLVIYANAEDVIGFLRLIAGDEISPQVNLTV